MAKRAESRTSCSAYPFAGVHSVFSEQENIATNRLQYNNENNICRGIRRARAKESLSAGYIGKRQTGIAKCKVRALLSKFNHADNMEGMWQQLTDKARGTLKVLDFIC